MTKVAGRHDFRGGYFVNFLLPRSLAAGDRQPARATSTSHGNTTGAARRRRPTNFYNQYAAFLLGLVGTANKSVQNELMTAREWQHALYIRDRWNVELRS